MRQNAARVAHLALIAGLLLVAGVAGVDVARAAGEQQPWLGVYMQEMSEELREGLDYDGPAGVIVSGVFDGSPAEKAGLLRDDVIVRLNGRLVDSPSELTEMVAEARVGQRMSVQVFREGALRTLGVTIGSRPAKATTRRIEIEVPDAPEPPTAPRAPRAPKEPKDVERRIIIRGPEDLEGQEGLEELDELKGFGFMGDGSGMMALAGRGRLGVRVEPLSPALGDYFGLKDGKGALVLEVLEGRPAEKAGLLAGDVITRLDDKPIANSRDLVEALRGKDGKVALRVMRHGAPRTVEATLDEPGATWVEKPGTPSSDGPGVQKRVIMRSADREDLRRELDQLKKELERLRQHLEQEGLEKDE
jgi:serine protease Do